MCAPSIPCVQIQLPRNGRPNATPTPVPATALAIRGLEEAEVALGRAGREVDRLGEPVARALAHRAQHDEHDDVERKHQQRQPPERQHALQRHRRQRAQRGAGRREAERCKARNEPGSAEGDRRQDAVEQQRCRHRGRHARLPQERDQRHRADGAQQEGDPAVDQQRRQHERAGLDPRHEHQGADPRQPLQGGRSRRAHRGGNRLGARGQSERRRHEQEKIRREQERDGQRRKPQHLAGRRHERGREQHAQPAPGRRQRQRARTGTEEVPDRQAGEQRVVAVRSLRQRALRQRHGPRDDRRPRQRRQSTQAGPEVQRGRREEQEARHPRARDQDLRVRSQQRIGDAPRVAEPSRRSGGNAGHGEP